MEKHERKKGLETKKKEDEFSKLDTIETDSVGLDFISENMSD